MLEFVNQSASWSSLLGLGGGQDSVASQCQDSSAGLNDGLLAGVSGSMMVLRLMEPKILYKTIQST